MLRFRPFPIGCLPRADGNRIVLETFFRAYEDPAGKPNKYGAARAQEAVTS